MFRSIRFMPFYGALLVLGTRFLQPAAAEMPSNAYSPIVLQARVLDRRGQPVISLPLRFAADLQGAALQDEGDSEGISFAETRTIKTDAHGLATWRVSGLPWTHESRWFRGRITLKVSLPHDAGRELLPLGDETLTRTMEFPMQEALSGPPTLEVYEEPNQWVGGFPVWTDGSGKMDKVVVVLEGFDLYNRISATDLMGLISPAADALRAKGVSVLIVHFPDSHLTPDKLAPRAVQAIQAAAHASGHSVAVVGLSAGGIVGRWALVETEEQGTPLPVNTFLSMDCPNRGARMNPQLQAIVLRYGTPDDKAALASEAARVLLDSQPADVRWKWIGLPLMGREMPVSSQEDTSLHDAFFDRLHHLNDHNGYPKHCRLIGVASGSRRGVIPGRPLISLWVPFNYSWTLPAAPEDHAPGSVLPPYYVGRFYNDLPPGYGRRDLANCPYLHSDCLSP